jgi:hypothetical protein
MVTLEAVLKVYGEDGTKPLGYHAILAASLLQDSEVWRFINLVLKLLPARHKGTLDGVQHDPAEFTLVGPNVEKLFKFHYHEMVQAVCL